MTFSSVMDLLTGPVFAVAIGVSLWLAAHGFRRAFFVKWKAISSDRTNMFVGSLVYTETRRQLLHLFEQDVIDAVQAHQYMDELGRAYNSIKDDQLKLRQWMEGDTIMEAFIWQTSPQGDDYWRKLNKMIYGPTKQEKKYAAVYD